MLGRALETHSSPKKKYRKDTKWAKVKRKVQLTTTQRTPGT